MPSSAFVCITGAVNRDFTVEAKAIDSFGDNLGSAVLHVRALYVCAHLYIDVPNMHSLIELMQKVPALFA